ncbi:MAG TPA: c-type cytochrome biogenesis protein CcsB [Coriobacteriia bacterium]|jgi:cytochrome c-type biogenesis protein CcsB
MTLEIVLMWAAVTLYAAGSVLFTVGFVFHRPLMRLAVAVSLAGLAPHTAATAIRWVRVGHPPMLGFYEVVPNLAWIAVVLFGLIVWRRRGLEPIGVVIMPISFLMIGASMLVAPRADMPLTPTLASWWLTIHISFAKLSYGSFLASFALAIVFLVRESGGGGRWSDVLEKLPSQAVIDDLSFKFIAAGFIFLGVMIAAGAIWANEAWGRYWNWDPIETWSLISWLVYAVYLHLRLTLGWRGKRAAWVAVAALPVVLFALVGVPLVYKSVHAAYLKGV